jgi:hypothetical protein
VQAFVFFEGNTGIFCGVRTVEDDLPVGRYINKFIVVKINF